MRVKAKDQRAVATLVDLYSDRLLRVATLILNDAYRAEDVVQESLMDAVTHISQFQGHSALYTWLYTILIRRCRKEQRRMLKLRFVPWSRDMLDGVADESEGPSDMIERDEGRIHVREAVAKLPPQYREAVALFYLEEQSIEAISSATGDSVGTIKSRLHRARRMLAEVLGKEE